MKKFLFYLAQIIFAACVAVFFSVTCHSQSESKQKEAAVEEAPENFLKNTHWQTSEIVGLVYSDTYTLQKPDTTQRFSYGNNIVFTDSIHFTSYYTAWCGNDCFTTVYGTYKLQHENEISFTVDSVTYHGDCAAPTENRKPVEFEYDYSIIGDTIKLTARKPQ